MFGFSLAMAARLNLSMYNDVSNFADTALLGLAIFLLPDDLGFHFPGPNILQCIVYFSVKKCQRQFGDEVCQNLCTFLS